MPNHIYEALTWCTWKAAVYVDGGVRGSTTIAYHTVIQASGLSVRGRSCLLLAANRRRMRHRSMREVYVNTPVKMYKSTLTSLVLRTVLRVR